MDIPDFLAFIVLKEPLFSQLRKRDFSANVSCEAGFSKAERLKADAGTPGLLICQTLLMEKGIER